MAARKKSKKSASKSTTKKSTKHQIEGMRKDIDSIAASGKQAVGAPNGSNIKESSAKANTIDLPSTPNDHVSSQRERVTPNLVPETSKTTDVPGDIVLNNQEHAHFVNLIENSPVPSARLRRLLREDFPCPESYTSRT